MSYHQTPQREFSNAIFSLSVSHSLLCTLTAEGKKIWVGGSRNRRVIFKEESFPILLGQNIVGGPFWCPLFRQLWGPFGRQRWILGGAWGYITVIRHNLFIASSWTKLKLNLFGFLAARFVLFKGQLIPKAD